MNITINPIEVNTKLILKCSYCCSEEFESQDALDLHTNEKHKTDSKSSKDSKLDEIKDDLTEITFDIVEDTVYSKYKNATNVDAGDDLNTITIQPTPYMIEAAPQVPSNKTFSCCTAKNALAENEYQYSYKPEHNPEGCCDCEGVDCDNCWYDCGNCEDCNCNACCRECCDCDCNCDCDNCVIM